MTTNSHFQASTIGGIHQISMVEARYATLEGVQHRPGTTGSTPNSRQTIDAYNAWFHESELRDKQLAEPIRRAQANLGPDSKPIQGSETAGVNPSSYRPVQAETARGVPATPMMRGDVVVLPDKRESFGHNTKTRVPRVRGF